MTFSGDGVECSVRCVRTLTTMKDTQTLELDHHGSRIHYRWRKSSRASRFRVIVSPDGVELITPAAASQRDAERFLRLYADWVLAQQERVRHLEAKRRPPGAAMAGLPPGMIYYRGKKVNLEIRATTEKSKKPGVSVLGGMLKITTPSTDPRSAEAILEKFLKNQAKELIAVRVSEIASSLGKQPARVSIRSQKTRWGSCSSRKTLSFNWRLVMVPPEILDYVILHELVHLEEPNHSAAILEKIGSPRSGLPATQAMAAGKPILSL